MSTKPRTRLRLCGPGKLSPWQRATFKDVIVIREWNHLDPGVVEEKSLAHGVGVIFEEVVEGGTGRIELISFAPAP